MRYIVIYIVYSHLV